MPIAEYLQLIVKSIIEYNVNEALEQTQNILNEGKDLNNLIWEIIKYTKDILTYKASKELEIYNQEEKQAIKELSEKATKERLIKLIYDLSELENDIKQSTQKLIIFQTGIIKLCNQENYSELEERIAKLEKMISTGEAVINKTRRKKQGSNKS